MTDCNCGECKCPKFYAPETQLGQQLLASIPKKLVAWLNFLAVDITKPGRYGHLTWDFGNLDDMSITLHGEYFFEITDIKHTPSGTECSDPRVINIEQNLNWFVQLEHDIYQEMSKLEAELLAIKEKHE